MLFVPLFSITVGSYRPTFSLYFSLSLSLSPPCYPILLPHLPLQPVVYPQLVEQVHHVRVRPEEDVQPRLDPVSVFVLPRRNLPPQDIPGLVNRGLVPGLSEVLGAGKTGETATDYGDLLGGLGNVLTELCGEGLELTVGASVLDIRLRVVLIKPGANWGS